MEGVISLARTCRPLLALFEQELNLGILDMLELARYSLSIPAYGILILSRLVAEVCLSAQQYHSYHN